MRSTESCLGALALAGLLWAGTAVAAGATRPREVGSYQLDDGTALDIGPGAEDGKLRWRMTDGRTGALAPDGDGAWTSTLGWTGRADGHRVMFDDCGHGRIRFDDIAGHRVPLVEIDTRFQGSGVALAGRLTLPAGDSKGSGILEEYPTLSAYVARGVARPAYKRAFAAQLAVFTGKPPAGQR